MSLTTIGKEGNLFDLKNGSYFTFKGKKRVYQLEFYEGKGKKYESKGGSIYRTTENKRVILVKGAFWK